MTCTQNRNKGNGCRPVVLIKEIDGEKKLIPYKRTRVIVGLLPKMVQGGTVHKD